MVNSAYVQNNTSCFHPQIPPIDTGCSSQTYATCPQAPSLSPFSCIVYVNSRGFAFWKRSGSFFESGAAACPADSLHTAKSPAWKTTKANYRWVETRTDSAVVRISRPRVSSETHFASNRVQPGAFAKLWEGVGRVSKWPSRPKKTPTWVQWFLKQR